MEKGGGGAGLSSREARNAYHRERRKRQAESDHPADRARREIELAKQRERKRVKLTAETPQEREARLAAKRESYHARKRAKLGAAAAVEVAVQRRSNTAAESMERQADRTIRLAQCASATNRFKRDFTDNPFGYSRDVCDRLWHLKDLTPGGDAIDEKLSACNRSKSSSTTFHWEPWLGCDDKCVGADDALPLHADQSCQTEHHITLVQCARLHISTCCIGVQVDVS
ncbi:uncharacterized protein LOC142589871 [Dermacentor variabilis]|uniref:uncharacterized protein LOC142589871 n=1 Tax=Dermacentor variabilis TaxID=34621 RepID=UPI003F5B422B